MAMPVVWGPAEAWARYEIGDTVEDYTYPDLDGIPCHLYDHKDDIKVLFR